MDCAGDGRHRHESGQQDAHPVAVVHSVFLPGGDGQHLSVGGIARLSFAKQHGKIDADLHAVPDRSNLVASRPTQGWAAPANPRRSVVVRGSGGKLAGDTGGMDQHLRLIEHSKREHPLNLRKLAQAVTLAFLLALLPALYASAQTAPPQQPEQPPAHQAVHSHRPVVRESTTELCASCVQSNLTYLAGPALHGRGSGTEDEHHAAQFIAGKLKLYGLEPGAGYGQYIQTATMRSREVIGNPTQIGRASCRERGKIS